MRPYLRSMYRATTVDERVCAQCCRTVRALLDLPDGHNMVRTNEVPFGVRAGARVMVLDLRVITLTYLNLNMLALSTKHI